MTWTGGTRSSSACFYQGICEKGQVWLKETSMARSSIGFHGDARSCAFRGLANDDDGTCLIGGSIHGNPP